MELNTILSALAGGGLIGLAALLLMLGSGEVAGISGIVGNLVSLKAPDRLWRIAFVAGLVTGPVIASALGVEVLPIQVDASVPVLIIAGLLVGFGSRLGDGCTSGHGVCGIARLSTRSLVATAVFMACGALVVFVHRHVFGA